MDMMFRDDECLIRRDHAPANIATIAHIASNLMGAKADKNSVLVKRRLAAWDDA
jgi:predicted transposase YbfD/YdcC